MKMELPLHPTENLTGNNDSKKQIQKGTQCMIYTKSESDKIKLQC